MNPYNYMLLFHTTSHTFLLKWWTEFWADLVCAGAHNVCGYVIYKYRSIVGMV